MFVEIQALQSLCYMFIYIRQKIKLFVSCILYLVLRSLIPFVGLIALIACYAFLHASTW